MYVIKVIDAYFTGLGLSPSQADAKRFRLTSARKVAMRAWLDFVFGTDARLVRFTSRQDRIAADNRADYDSDVNLWSGDF